MSASALRDTVAYRSEDASSGRRPVEEVMLAEAMHRTANDMTVVHARLHLARRHVTDEAAAHIDAAIAHVAEVALVQRLLVPPLWRGPVDLAATIEKVCLAFSDARLADEGILLKVAVGDCVVDARDAWMICTIVIELVTNAARHAFAAGGGTIVVAGRRERGVLVVAVADDGPAAGRSRLRSESGRGTGIVDAMVEELGGGISRTTGPDGTKVELWLGSS